MDRSLYEMIFKRKSFHIFRNTGYVPLTEEELRQIEKAYGTFLPLVPGIRTAMRIVKGSDTSCRRGEEYCILLYSEKKEGCLQNIGYIGEQLDLYLVSRNIGTLWFGIGRPDEPSFDSLDFIIMIAMRKVENVSSFRKDMFRSKRKQVCEIWEGESIEGITDIVRFAPSACNTQPWLIRNDGDLRIYRYRKQGKRGIMPADRVTFYNRIDMGIFLCFLELCLEHRGTFFERKLLPDAGGDEELTLNAVYSLKGS